VILLDEIEEAHSEVVNILLQVVDDGRWTDNKGRVANFKNTIIIMTTNIGSTLIQESFEKMEEWNQEEVIEDTKNQVFDLLKKSVRPEFLNRVDETIMFRPLSKEDLGKIVKIQFKLIQDRLEENGVRLDAEDNVLEHLGNIGFDPQFGARPLKRVLQREILNELSKDILSGKVKKDAVIGVTLGDNNRIEFINLDEISVE
jgi:ATP-dependent Clp protease ATP-binding subunit ClpB